MKKGPLAFLILIILALFVILMPKLIPKDTMPSGRDRNW